MDLKQKAFVVYVTIRFNPIEVHLDREVQIAALIADKALVIIPTEYSDFEDMFSKKSAAVLSEHIEINTHTIDLEKSKQPSYRSIYSLRSVELETFRTHIETNLANGFICPSKSPVSAPIIFSKKPDRSL